MPGEALAQFRRLQWRGRGQTHSSSECGTRLLSTLRRVDLGDGAAPGGRRSGLCSREVDGDGPRYVEGRRDGCQRRSRGSICVTEGGLRNGKVDRDCNVTWTRRRWRSEPSPKTDAELAAPANSQPHPGIAHVFRMPGNVRGHGTEKTLHLHRVLAIPAENMHLTSCSSPHSLASLVLVIRHADGKFTSDQDGDVLLVGGSYRT
jgi:hypothetical protein